MIKESDNLRGVLDGSGSLGTDLFLVIHNITGITLLHRLAEDPVLNSCFSLHKYKCLSIDLLIDIDGEAATIWHDPFSFKHKRQWEPDGCCLVVNPVN